MNIKSILLASILSSTASFAFANTFATVCGYMPENLYQEPVEHTLTGDSFYPQCPESISRTSSSTSVVAIPNPQAPGGVTYVQSHDQVTQTWVLVYELPGGY